jgi:hypothetical protein
VVAECGTLAQELEACGPSIPAACNADLACIAFSETGGTCYQLCDPASPVCDSGLSCLAVLSAPDAGICAHPAAAGGTCDQSQQLFCPAGQICLGAGNCLKRCDPTQATDCPQLETCVTPSPFDLGVSICVQPQPVGSPCSPVSSVYCDRGAFCVFVGDAGGRCLQDCTDGGSCPPTQACEPITDQSMTYVAGACF